MAEENGTQGTAGQATEPGTTDPGNSTSRATTTVDVPLASSGTPQIDYAAEIAALRQTTERHKQQLEGSAAEARRLKEENERLRAQYEQAAQQQQVLQQLGTVLAGGNLQGQQRGKPKDLREAVDRYLAGDDAALQGLSPVTPDDVDQRVDQRFQAYLAYAGRSQTLFTAHPELNNPKDPVYAAAFTAYDQLASDPLVKVLYPDDQGMQITLAAPDGTAKVVDLRILDRAMLTAKTAHAREQGAAEETRRQSIGDAAVGTGRQTSSQGLQVEAIEMFSPAELAQYQDPDFAKALRAAGLQTDPKSLAKWIWDGLSPTDKAKRIEACQARGARIGA